MHGYDLSLKAVALMILGTDGLAILIIAVLWELNKPGFRSWKPIVALLLLLLVAVLAGRTLIPEHDGSVSDATQIQTILNAAWAMTTSTMEIAGMAIFFTTLGPIVDVATTPTKSSASRWLESTAILGVSAIIVAVICWSLLNTYHWVASANSRKPILMFAIGCAATSIVTIGLCNWIAERRRPSVFQWLYKSMLVLPIFWLVAIALWVSAK